MTAWMTRRRGARAARVFAVTTAYAEDLTRPVRNTFLNNLSSREKGDEFLATVRAA
jgi:hypothetical protein